MLSADVTEICAKRTHSLVVIKKLALAVASFLYLAPLVAGSV